MIKLKFIVADGFVVGWNFFNEFSSLLKEKFDNILRFNGIVNTQNND
jgi:hypothetical protein